jgi:hypothetical protein
MLIRTPDDRDTSEQRGEPEAGQHLGKICSFHADSPPFLSIENNPKTQNHYRSNLVKSYPGGGKGLVRA